MALFSLWSWENFAYVVAFLVSNTRASALRIILDHVTWSQSLVGGPCEAECRPPSGLALQSWDVVWLESWLPGYGP